MFFLLSLFVACPWALISSWLLPSRSHSFAACVSKHVLIAVLLLRSSHSLCVRVHSLVLGCSVALHLLTLSLSTALFIVSLVIKWNLWKSFFLLLKLCAVNNAIHQCGLGSAAAAAVCLHSISYASFCFNFPLKQRAKSTKAALLCIPFAFEIFKRGYTHFVRGGRRRGRLHKIFLSGRLSSVSPSVHLFVFQTICLSVWTSRSLLL